MNEEVNVIENGENQLPLDKGEIKVNYSQNQNDKCKTYNLFRY